MTIRVLVADDQELLRSAVVMMLGTQPDIEVVGQAANGLDAVAVSAQAKPDVVIMDVRMPVLDGVEATRRIIASGPRPKVLMLTTFDLDEHAFGALQAGASGFLLKDASGETIIAAVRSVNAGDAVISPSTTRRLLDHVAGRLAPSTRHAAALRSLTDREREVFGALASGASNAEIAQQFFLSETTVKTHVGHVLRKLQVRDRVQAVVVAYESGMVRPAG